MATPDLLLDAHLGLQSVTSIVSLQSLMEPSTPPPLIPPARPRMSLAIKLVIGIALIPSFLVGTLILMRVCGLLRPFSVPTNAMAPTISAGDHILMEGFTFLSRKPRRGDSVVFKTDGIGSLPPSTIYVKRVAGEPGEHVRISEGKLFVNDKQVSLSNETGEIVYELLPNSAGISPQTDATVPSGCYYVLGDNTTNSLDSRFFGGVSRGNIIGRISFCYWPPERRGLVK